MSSAKKLQHRLFGGPSSQPASGESSPGGLFISSSRCNCIHAHPYSFGHFIVEEFNQPTKLNLTLPSTTTKEDPTPASATPPTAMPSSVNAQGLKLNIPPASAGAGNTIATSNDSATDANRKTETPASLPKRPSLPTSSDLTAPELIKSSPQSGTPTEEARQNAEDGEPRTAGASELDTPRNRDELTLRDKLMKSMGPRYTSVEEFRLDQVEHYEKHWRRWGPYLSERQWVRAQEKRGETQDLASRC